MSIAQPGLIARYVSISVLSLVALRAQPALTTIQDVLYKADGTPFNGYVQISWTSFQAADTSNIATQFRAVRIVNGNFLVKLVPTTNADPSATYAVTYNSDGRVQFQETWAVPPSSHALRISDVRISTPSALSTGSGSPIQESDVVGLVADLNSRPIEGPGYATSRVMVSNSAGQVEAVAGNLSDCVHVDGSSGPCGSGGSGGAVPGYTDAETPAGTIDGNNATFTLAGTPSPASSLALYRNGMLQKASFDYSLSGSTIQFVTAAKPQPGDTLLASYRVASTGSSTPVPGYTDAETPGGTLDGNNATFTLATPPNPASSLALYRNGMLQKANFDYSLSGGTVQFVTAAKPQPGDTLLASYRVSGSSSQLSADSSSPGAETLCSSTGASTLNSSSASLGSCVIPAGTLNPGDRVEIRFDIAHTGTQSGFNFQVQWGATTLLARSASSTDAYIAARSDAAITTAGAQLSTQSWGSALAFAAGVGFATDVLSTPLTINFSGNLAQAAGDSITLNNFTVLRYFH